MNIYINIYRGYSYFTPPKMPNKQTHISVTINYRLEIFSDFDTYDLNCGTCIVARC